MTSIEITVRQSGGAYVARVGRGKSSKTASSTNSAYWAALAAAEKYFSGKSVLVDAIDGSEQHATKFRAHSRDGVKPASKPLTLKKALLPAATAKRIRNTQRPRASRS